MMTVRTMGRSRIARSAATVACALLTAIVIGAAVMSCNQPFDPRAPLDSQLVVYALVSTDRDAQFVRVNSNYMPSSFDANSYTGDNAVRDAYVTISTPGSLLTFRDTVIARSDSSRYKTPIFLYTARPFVPQRGRPYELLVVSPSIGTASATFTVPTKPTITMDPASYVILSNPLSAAATSMAQFTVVLSSYARGYSGHLYIYYDVLKGSRWVEERVEVPYSSSVKDTTFNIDQDTTYNLEGAQYQDLTVAPQSNKVVLQFTAGYLSTIVKHLTKIEYVNTHLIYKWIVLVVLQADQNLFGYFKSIRGYQDPLSIRLDQPMYSSINGAVGMVGSYSLDSLTYVLPEKFNGNR